MYILKINGNVQLSGKILPLNLYLYEEYIFSLKEIAQGKLTNS